MFTDQIKSLETWEEKYEFLVEIGQSTFHTQPIPKQNINLVNGCQSRVWLDFKTIIDESKTRVFWINGCSDSRLVQGLLNLVLEIYNLKTAEQILQINDHWLTEIGLDKNLSGVRKNGLASIIKAIKGFVVADQV
jgi:cysteine desulfuration protein SufE